MKKAISRRDFLKVVGVSAAALGMTACGGSSASTSTSTAVSTAASSTASSAAAGAGEGGSGNDYKLTWNEVNGEDYGATVGAHTFAEKIEELSGGHITIDLYINGTLGSEAESMQGIQMGTLDIFRGNASSLPNYGAELIGTTGLAGRRSSQHVHHPEGLRASGQAHRLHAGQDEGPEGPRARDGPDDQHHGCSGRFRHRNRLL